MCSYNITFWEDIGGCEMDSYQPFVVGGYGAPAYAAGDIDSPFYGAAQAEADRLNADYYYRQAEEHREQED